MHIAHKVLRPETVAFRGYQANLARIAGQKDTLVVLPTGMGKTIVALLTLADAFQAGAKRALLLAPTRPLVEQHGAFFQDVLAEPWGSRVQVMTGTVAPTKRAEMYKEEGLLCATPQTLQNDVVNGRVDLATFDWIVFDECHRAVGDYPYTFLGEAARKAGNVRVLGLTASPGHDARKINEVRTCLGFEHVEIRTPNDPDVREYVQDVGVEWETLPLPPGMANASKRLQDALADRVRELKAMKLLQGASRPTRMALLEAGKKAQSMLKRATDPDPSLYAALSLQAQAMKILHAIEQAETQGTTGLLDYLEALRDDVRKGGASKASVMVVNDARIKEAIAIAKQLREDNPKMERAAVLVHELLESSKDGLAIVFTQYRSTCEAIVKRLESVPGARPVVFVGQGKRRGQKGLTQKEQAEVLQRFRKGEHNVLVATSVAEEGLDIPATDLVVFFEPIPSEIRSIQRRGRTGRTQEGRVVVLMTKGTQDEAAHWVARRKEQQMVQELHNLRAALSGAPAAAPKGQTTLDQATRPASMSPAAERAPEPAGTPDVQVAMGTGPRIVMDAREQGGSIAKHLHALGARLETKRLDVADYILSDRVAVERKTATDLVDSLIDGRLFDQVATLKAYPRAFMVVEGTGLYTHRKVAPEAILGALASLSVDFGIPVLRTEDGLETARFLVTVAKREQQREGRGIALRPAPAKGLAARQLHLIAGLPGISETRAKALLEHFGSCQAVFGASEEALAGVESIGPKTAAEVRRLLDAPFAELERSESVR